MLSKTNLPQDLSQLSQMKSLEYDPQSWHGAVVFLVVENSLCLIRRSDTMPTHKGQIGFIGGHKTAAEVDPMTTALREFTEESNLSHDLLEIKGLIHPVMTSKRRMIIPVVAEYKESKNHLLKNIKSNGEWDNLILVPLDILEQDSYWSFATLHAEKKHQMYFFPLMHEFCEYLNTYEKDCYVLWGATAKMIVNFFQKHMLSDKK